MLIPDICLNLNTRQALYLEKPVPIMTAIGIMLYNDSVHHHVELSSGVDVEVSGGTRMSFGPADVLLLENTTRREQESPTVNNQQRKSIFVTID